MPHVYQTPPSDRKHFRANSLGAELASHASDQNREGSLATGLTKLLTTR
jgi:hypothetical protein